MIDKLRRAAPVVLAAIALGIIAPAAGARPADPNSGSSSVSTGSTQAPASRSALRASRSHGGAISGWGYVAIATGAASFALISIAGTHAASRRRQQRRTARQSIAA